MTSLYELHCENINTSDGQIRLNKGQITIKEMPEPAPRRYTGLLRCDEDLDLYFRGDCLDETIVSVSPRSLTFVSKIQDGQGGIQVSTVKK